MAGGGLTLGKLLPYLDAPPEVRTEVMSAPLAHEVQRLESRRRDIDRELGVPRTLRRRPTNPDPPNPPGPFN
jgi:hypothetical protein